jgi:hypothetical protein
MFQNHHKLICLGVLTMLVACAAPADEVLDAESRPRQLLTSIAPSDDDSLALHERTPGEIATPGAVGAVSPPASTAFVAIWYDFSSFAGIFAVGDVINLADAVITFHQFQWVNFVWTANGSAEVVASNFAAGTPTKELNLNNIMVRVTPDIPAAGAHYLYADLGGNTNFGVNGDFRNVGDLIALDGTMVGGCNISVTKIGGNPHRGEVQITPQAGVTIEKFGVGGQEFYLDDVRFW